jgi:hypothetical protein
VAEREADAGRTAAESHAMALGPGAVGVLAGAKANARGGVALEHPCRTARGRGKAIRPGGLPRFGRDLEDNRRAHKGVDVALGTAWFQEPWTAMAVSGMARPPLWKQRHAASRAEGIDRPM